LVIPQLISVQAAEKLKACKSTDTVRFVTFLTEHKDQLDEMQVKYGFKEGSHDPESLTLTARDLQGKPATLDNLKIDYKSKDWDGVIHYLTAKDKNVEITFCMYTNTVVLPDGRAFEGGLTEGYRSLPRISVQVTESKDEH
jgi:hypothetical protein